MRSKNSFKNKVFSKKNIKKKLTLFFFRTESCLWTKLKKTKRSLNWWPVAPQVAKQVYKVSLFVIYYLLKFDGVIKSSSWLIPKISPANLCKPNHDIIFFSFSFPLLILQNVERKGNITIWISWEWKKLFRWNKKYFPQFLMGCHLVKK